MYTVICHVWPQERLRLDAFVMRFRCIEGVHITFSNLTTVLRALGQGAGATCNCNRVRRSFVRKWQATRWASLTVTSMVLPCLWLGGGLLRTGHGESKPLTFRDAQQDVSISSILKSIAINRRRVGEAVLGSLEPMQKHAWTPDSLVRGL